MNTEDRLDDVERRLAAVEDGAREISDRLEALEAVVLDGTYLPTRRTR